MKNNKTEQKKTSLNIIAVLLAFLTGITVGSFDTDRLHSDASTYTSGTGLTGRYEAYRLTAEKSGEEASESEAVSDDLSFTVYITPTGKRYHLDAGCAGENKIECSLEEAADKGLTPCKRCADG